MVNGMKLGAIKRKGNDLDPRLLKAQHGQNRLVWVGPVVSAAPAQENPRAPFHSWLSRMRVADGMIRSRAS